MPPRRIHAAIAVIARDGKFLVTRRPAGAHLAGRWEFPGGKRMARETLAACAAREVREELGVSVRVGRRLTILRYQYPDRRVSLHVFRCSIRRGRPKPLGASAIRWVSPAQLRRLRMPPANRPLIALLAKGV